MTDLTGLKVYTDCESCAIWREREAAVCPEDVAFDEYIPVLEKKIEAKKKQALIVGEYEITEMDSGSFWIRRQGGEGMEVNEHRMVKLINDFWNAEW